MGRKNDRDIILVIDLEATCWEGSAPEGMYNEIIEIGISGVNSKTRNIEFKDSIIVKPENSEISEFCTNLTTLTQEFVDKNGVTLQEAFNILESRYRSRSRVWSSWGEYDKNQISKECELKGLKNPMHRVHFNLKTLFCVMYALSKEVGVAKALDRMGMKFEGTHHRGDDDAYNIARILNKMFLPIMSDETFSKVNGMKKSHEILADNIENNYPKEEISSNVLRLLGKKCP